MDAFESDSDASQAILTAASERGQWREVLLLHRRLLDCQPEQAGEIYASAASGLIKAQQWQRALGLIGDLEESAVGLSFWSTACTDEAGASTSMFQLLLSSFGSWEQAIALLEQVGRCPEALSTKEVFYTMSELRRQQQWHVALQVFTESLESPGADVQTYKSAMKAWSFGHHWQQVVRLLAETRRLDEQQGYDGAIFALCQATLSLMRGQPGPPDSPAETSAAALASAASAAVAASQMLRDMRSRELSPSRRLYGQAIAANARAGNPDQALQLLRQVGEEGLPRMSQLYRSCMRAFQAASRWQQALLLEKEASPVDADSFEAGIFAASKKGRWQLAAELLNDMQEQQMSPKGVVYAKLISACASAKQWRYALWFLRKMEVTGADRSEKNKVILYGAVVTAMKPADWQRALRLLREMPAQKVLPNVVTYGAVASVCNRAKKYLYSLQLHEEMQQKELHPDVPSFKLAVGACRGRLQELLEAQPATEGRQKQKLL